VARGARGIRVGLRWFRSLFGLDVFQRVQHRAPRAYLGGSGCAYCVCTDGLTASTVVYSFGIGRDLGFEIALVERYGLRVHAFDPTPVSQEWLRSQTLPALVSVHAVGLAAFDGVARFAPPRRSGWDSFSMVRDAPAQSAASAGTSGPIEAPVQRLKTIAARLGHACPDVLKLDIEGAEYAVLPALLADGLRPYQILVEFHHNWRELGARPTREAIALLNRNGYRVANVSASGLEYTFLRVE
jgi:FkbM family methyltransferase